MPINTIKSFFPGVVFAAFSIMFLSACADKNYVFDQNIEIPNARWIVSDRAILKVNITDTISQHNFYINVRNTEAYPYRNLYVFVTTVFPNEKSSRDTVGIVLADASGRWLGSGNGFLSSSQHLTNTIMYQYNKRFPIAGEYIFEIEQAMREDTLVGVQNIGLKIEKTSTRK